MAEHTCTFPDGVTIKPGEVFSEIDGYDGYWVSNIGRVISFKKNRTTELKQSKTQRGYLTVRLYNNVRWKIFAVHRLVAIAFIENPFGYTEVNHIDEDKMNNASSNLEWCNRSMNLHHGCYRENMRNKLMNRKDLSMTVMQHTQSGEFVAEFQSTAEAGRITGLSQSCISACARGKRKSVGGFVWTYKAVI